MAEVITQVRVYDRQEDQILVIGNEECAFAYRTSLFKIGAGAAARGVGQPGTWCST